MSDTRRLRVVRSGEADDGAIQPVNAAQVEDGRRSASRSVWRVVLTGWIWRVGTWLAARRRVRTRRVDYVRQDFRTQTRGMGLRMGERLRDRLRPGWLRLRRTERRDGASADE